MGSGVAHGALHARGAAHRHGSAASVEDYPHLVGMLLIIVGLYSFLWAKNKELKSATDQAKLAAAGEQGKTVPDSEAEMQLTAVVVPTDSTVHTDDVEGLPNRNQPEPLNV
ncbi:hypothetical protein RJ639_001095 [Escallonia herrerae]|uniref:Uncharacterized protein n=1 Tax=Escallonia herrerae TaxID=1293975 RepID=A0AA88XA97_9ASTE|nr:hypothetical protein RJ639_001095 [Escallonia herrerae]